MKEINQKMVLEYYLPKDVTRRPRQKGFFGPINLGNIAN